MIEREAVGFGECLADFGVVVVIVGEFGEAKVRVVRRTRALIFMSGEFMVGDRTVATANGVWTALGDR